MLYKGDDKMIDFDENARNLLNLENKVNKIGESL